MRKEPKPSPTESPLLFEIAPVILEETLTALGGIPLVVQAFRSLGLRKSVRAQVRVKERERGYDEKVKREENVGVITPGHDVVSYPLVTPGTRRGMALHAGGGKVPRLLNSHSR
jgi:hypothetical protein